MKTKILLIIALLIALAEGVRGQIYINSYRFGEALLLDNYPNSEAAFSLRLLRTGYTGNCIMVRRSSNGDSTNIGFVNNYLDTATLKTFCSGTNCFVRVWYDQSGNARDARQTTDANQPTIATSGAIFYKGTTPSIDFDGTNDNLSIANSTSTFNFLHNGNTSAVFSLQHVDEDKTGVILANNGTTGSKVGFAFYSAINTFKITSSISDGTGFFPAIVISANNTISTNNFIASILLDGDNATAAERLKLYVNGNNTTIIDNTETRAVSSSNAGFNLNMGSSANNSLYLNGGLKEIVIYNANQASNRTAIRDNINTFYSIY